MWAEDTDVISDAQNGFRTKRSTIDHIQTMTSIIDTRKGKKKSTFVAFIDLRKAYDSINRNKLWEKLAEVGVNDRMFQAVKSLYSDVKCCVRINGLYSEWFNVSRGLKQSCLLSPILFNIYINDLLTTLNNFNIGIQIDDDLIAALAYADDLAIMAETERDLNLLLDVLNLWCQRNELSINMDKSKVVHFRSASIPRTDYIFKIGQAVLETVPYHTYLGLLYMNEHLDYNLMAKTAAKSAGRALGLLISKSKMMGGMPFNSYTCLYDSMVWSTLNYGVSIWGSYDCSAVNAIHHRAIRYFMGLGKYAPNVAVNGDSGWVPPYVRQWKAIARRWWRMNNIQDGICKRVFNWAERCARSGMHNWNKRVNKKWNELNISLPNTCRSSFYENVNTRSMESYQDRWKELLRKEMGGKGRNKLRTYRTFKENFTTEHYLHTVSNKRHRSALAKFRCGVAPLHVETGRYQNTPLEDRTCFNCHTHVENEEHVLLKCPLYDDFRQDLFTQCLAVDGDFMFLSDNGKLCFILSNVHISRFSAKICHFILKRRQSILYA